MADDPSTTIRKNYSRPYSDPLNPVRAEHTPVSERQRRLWTALSEYITANGGMVVSIPFLKTLRLEVSPGSPLPAKLREFGYTVRHAGTGTHLSPGNTPAEIFRAVDVVEITLSGNNTR